MALALGLVLGPVWTPEVGAAEGVLATGRAAVVEGVVAGAGGRRDPPGPRALAAAGRYDRDRVLDAYARSWVPGRSGDVVFVPRPGIFFTTEDVRYNHGSPWDYDTLVPLAFYGPGQFRPGRVRIEGADGADVAPTLLAALGLPPLPAAEGRARVELLEAERPRLRAVLVVMMDQVGFQDLERYGGELPNLARWRGQGADLSPVRLGHLPAVTAVAHATVGTGTRPRRHGIANNVIPVADRSRLRVVIREGRSKVDPSMVRVPTLGDWMDLELGNRAIVLSHVSAEYASVAMGGHGLAWPGGDADFVWWFDHSAGKVATDERLYRMPEWLRTRSAESLVVRHGASPMQPGLKQPGTLAYRELRTAPWFARWQADLTLEAMIREGVGLDDVPDLVQVNLKSTDSFGHRYGRDPPGFLDCLREIDRFLGAAERLLAERCGAGAFAAALTSDHGCVPDDGAKRIHRDLLEWLGGELDRTGDRDGVRSVLDMEAYHLLLDRAELASEGHSPETVRDLLLRHPDVQDAFTGAEIEARAVRLGLE